MKNPEEVAKRLFGQPYEKLDAAARNVAKHIANRTHLARNINLGDGSQPSFGLRAADAVASFGGSWTFVGLFAGTMLLWVVVNAYLLSHLGKTFDPYPYILLNLFLSMLAAIQAPIILMSQNRQTEKDRIASEHDYEVNLKAELEIMLLHEKIDLLRDKQWEELIEIQREQLRQLSLLTGKPAAPP
ncbi:MAG: putative transrane protein [Rhodoferax sp.]|nr:putative transrane protein [Rhodoferax sp.]